MSERNRDPGVPLDSQGIPDVADDATPEREELPEPQRTPAPAETPVVSTDYGTTAAEQRAGEPHERKLQREIREDVDESVVDDEGVVPPYDEQAEQNLSPYERQIPPAEEDLSQHEGP